VATVLSFDGTIVVWLVEELLEDEELDELELDDEEAGVMHGGTISVRTLELAGTTSWFDGFAPEADCACAPPGVTSTVLEAGGETAPLEEELDELELEEELEAGGWHGWTATVWVTLPGGIVTVFEPVGGFDAPCWAAAASAHGGTATVSGPLRGEICTVRTPGFIRAVDTGSEEDDDELDDEDELPPQAASPVTITALTVSPATRVAAELALIPMLLLLEVGARARLWLVAAPVRQALPTRYCGLTRRLCA
jgi:hypothetical protein